MLLTEAGDLAAVSQRADRAVLARLTHAERRFASAAKLLGAVSYQAVLERGFALVRRKSNEPVRRKAEIATGEALQVEFADGRLAVTAGEGAAPTEPPRHTAKSATRTVRRSRGSKKVDDAQGVLF